MKPASGTKIFALLLLAMTAAILMMITIGGHDLRFDAFGQGFEDNNNDNNKKYDMVILSQTYFSKFISDDLAGEILNNGTSTIKAVEITAIFYDDQDDIIGNAASGTTPYTINPGDTASFTIKIFDEGIKINASSYDFTAKWRDEYLASSYFSRLTGGEISDNDRGVGGGGGDDDDDNDDDDNDDDDT
jgi:hypothetical protein